MEFSWYTLDEMETPLAVEMFTLRHQVFSIEQGLSGQDVDQVDKICHHLCVTEGKEVIGCLRLYKTETRRMRRTRETFEIGRLCVKETHRNQQIAKKMMWRAILKGMESNPKAEVEIDAQLYLRDFCESLGFQALSDPYLEDSIPHLRMGISQASFADTKKAAN